MPFVILRTSPDNEIHLEWRNEKREALLSCEKSLEVCDDVMVLEFMHMAQVESEEELRQVFARCPDVATLLLERNPGVGCRLSAFCCM
jgi:hypothetical protein